MPPNPMDFKAKWASKRATLAAVTSQGSVYVEFDPRINKVRFLVAAPYNQSFVDIARACNGRWRKRTNRWSFEIKYLPFLVRRCRLIFGQAHVITKGISAKQLIEPPTVVEAVDEDSPAPW